MDMVQELPKEKLDEIFPYLSEASENIFTFTPYRQGQILAQDPEALHRALESIDPLKQREYNKCL